MDSPPGIKGKTSGIKGFFQYELRSIVKSAGTSEDAVVKGEVTKDVYGLTDFDRNIIIPERTEMIAKAILEHIKTMDKSIVFCVDQNHGLSTRDAINKHKQIRDPEYCVRITSDEGLTGRRLLERFQNNDKDIPRNL